MRLTRRRRRALGAAAGIAYLLLVAWLVSPVWRPAETDPPERIRISPLTSGRPIGVSAPEKAPALPSRLPGSAVVSATADPEAETAEATEESATEASSTALPEEASASPETSESQSSSPTGGGSSGGAEEETIIGFEG